MKAYAVAGRPVLHSRSPAIHRALFDACGIRASYTRATAETAGDVLRMARGIGLSGFNVTAPFKEEMAGAVDACDPVSMRLGAVNTVLLGGGRATGFNTDPSGIRFALGRCGFRTGGSTAVVVGAGGAAKAAAWALLGDGARVAVVNRAEGRARLLAESLDCGWRPWSELSEAAGGADLFVSCIPSGDDGVPELSLRPGQTVLFSDYRDSASARRAAASGCRVASGLDWLAGQATHAFSLFSGNPPTGGMLELSCAAACTPPRPARGVALAGMMGSGKSRVGAMLAEKAGRDFIDTDRLVEQSAGLSTAEIFRRYGEEHFRKLETEAVFRAAASRDAVVALGGGAVLGEENRRALREAFAVVWLWADPDTLYDRVAGTGRPLVREGGRERFHAVYRARLHVYAAAADLVVDASQIPEELCGAILREVAWAA